MFAFARFTDLGLLLLRLMVKPLLIAMLLARAAVSLRSNPFLCSCRTLYKAYAEKGMLKASSGKLPDVWWAHSLLLASVDW